MASTSFYRRAAVPSSRALQFSVRSPSILIRPAQATYTRQFSLSSRCTKEYPEKLSTNESTKTDQYPDDEHSTKKAHKGDDFDVQTSNVKGGME
ncbi:hypothetical protein BU26DRAFT_517683 [Trematosphaeria pertusa]|uniref:Uncharacterized protein n=1 Tax=Trematosphaeria pertusa TaxID=390896 RepID=A0A6A6ILF5_9PLEO|nr:uncharacterized protein BU26DRAFT_517683 [Trematosphaeria pertusa]KAF2250898.1 hypothetical protein BU26DRAFT_517683 [Trematosphaeria pertusa]